MRAPCASLEARYGEPRRRHHTPGHIRACLQLLDGVQGLTREDRRLLEYAIWWHDAVYDPARSDNEEQSAELARSELAGLGRPDAEIDEVARLVLLTKGHRVEPGDRLGALLVSIDLSILGADPQAYDAYAGQIREEYSHVPAEAFRIGRAAVLHKILEGPAIFPDPAFRDRYEAAARSNLDREIRALVAGGEGAVK